MEKPKGLSLIIAERLSKGKPWAAKRGDDMDHEDSQEEEDTESKDESNKEDRKALRAMGLFKDTLDGDDDEASLEAFRNLMECCQ